MKNFPSQVFRVQLSPKLNDKGLPYDAFFDERNPFDFDSENRYFAYVTDYVKFCNLIKTCFSDFLFVESIACYDLSFGVRYEN